MLGKNKILKMQAKKMVLVDRNAIEEELVNSDVLVNNRIQPYFSLSCFRNIDYDIKHCERTCPQNIFYRCLKIFEGNGYLIGGVK